MIKELGIKEDVLLSRYTTFSLGGRAKYFLEVKDRKELERGIIFAKEKRIPFLIIGNGSNILVSDKGYNGIVIKFSAKKISLNKETLTLDPGVLLSSLSSFCFDNGLSGLEWSAGIPGTVGGAVRGNAGAFGSSISDVVTSIEVFDSKNGKVRRIKNKYCEFGYRTSIIKKNFHLTIIQIEIKLKKKNKKEIKKKIKNFLDYRKERHPQGFSAGSIFKNYQFKNRKEKNDFFLKFPELEKIFTSGIIPSAFLIEKCGLKGKTIGKIKVSSLHSNFIINLGGGKSADVIRLIKIIKESVKKKFGIKIEEEIEYIGFSKQALVGCLSHKKT